MATAKSRTESDGLQKLKEDLKGNRLGCAYLFYGEESYLRERYLAQVRKALNSPGFEEFNYHVLEGKNITAQELTEMAEAMPMMSQRTLIVVTDWEIFKLGEEQREKLIALLEDIPPYCCLVFVYDTVAYKPNKTMKKLVEALENHVQAVEFRPAQEKDLINWITRHFQEWGKEIDASTAEYLIFLCGGLMTSLAQEIEKISAYAKGTAITRKDIDAVAAPVLPARVFSMTDAVVQGRYDLAAAQMSDLLKMQEEPVMILGALGNQMRRLYTARLALDGGKDRYWLMRLWEMKSNYQAKLLLDAAKHTTAHWCAEAVKLCQATDLRMKSQRGIGEEEELKLLLARLGAQRG